MTTTESSTDTPPSTATGRQWRSITEFSIKPKTKTYVIKIGDMCKVAGFGRGGAAGSGWQIIAAEEHMVTGKINVTVLNDGRNRIVELSRIVYVRPMR